MMSILDCTRKVAESRLRKHGSTEQQKSDRNRDRAAQPRLHCGCPDELLAMGIVLSESARTASTMSGGQLLQLSYPVQGPTQAHTSLDGLTSITNEPDASVIMYL